MHEREAPAELSPHAHLWDHVYDGGKGYLGLFSADRTDGRLTEPRSAYFPYPANVHEADEWITDQLAAHRETYQTTHLLTHPHRKKEYAAPHQCPVRRHGSR